MPECFRKPVADFPLSWRFPFPDRAASGKRMTFAVAWASQKSNSESPKTKKSLSPTTYQKLSGPWHGASFRVSSCSGEQGLPCCSRDEHNLGTKVGVRSQLLEGSESNPHRYCKCLAAAEDPWPPWLQSTDQTFASRCSDLRCSQECAGDRNGGNDFFGGRIALMKSSYPLPQDQAAIWHETWDGQTLVFYCKVAKKALKPWHTWQLGAFFL